MKSRGSIARYLVGSQVKSRARTGMSRAHTGMSRARVGMARTRTGMARGRVGADRARTGMYRAQTRATGMMGRMIPVSTSARRMAADRMMSARDWTAPRLDQAADYFNDSMAPRIGSALSGTAAWMRPPRRRSGGRTLLMGALAACVAGAAMATMLNRRRHHQMQHLLQPEEGLEYEHRREQRATGSYSPSGYDSSYGEVGRGSGTGHHRGIGGVAPE